jgi:hypothetical protein
MNSFFDTGIKIFSRKGSVAKNGRSKPTQPRRQYNRYSCVEVVAASSEIDSRSLCNAYHAQKRKRYLPAEAPNLPLAECDKDSCQCRYQYLDDRRTEERRNVFGMQNAVNRSTNRADKRVRRDRRKGHASHPIN